MRRDDQAVDLLVAVVGEREHRPVVAGFAAAHLDAADDAVGAGRGRNLYAVAVGALKLDRVGQINSGGVDADIDSLDRRGAGDTEPGRKRKGRERRGGANKCQKTTPTSRRTSRPDNLEIPHIHSVAGFAPKSRLLFAWRSARFFRRSITSPRRAAAQEIFPVFSKGQDNLADVRARLHPRMGGRRVSKRKGRVDHRLDLPGRQQRQDLGLDRPCDRGFVGNRTRPQR